MSIRLKFRESTVRGKEGILFFQVIHKRSIRRVNTRHRIMPSEWDAQSECVIMPSPQSPRYCKLCTIASDIDWEMKRFALLEKAYEGKPLDEIATVFQGEGDEGKGLFDFMRSQAERLKKLNRERCSETMLQTLRSFMRFRGGIDISLSKLTKDVVERYEAWLKGRGLKRNTSSFYLRTLRNAYNIAVEQGLVSNTNPFKYVYTGKDKTLKRALLPRQVKDILDVDLSSKPHLEFARDMFMFSIYARGMAFVDMAYLRKKDLQGDHFTYYRRKTGQMLSVEWIPEMQQILDKYTPNTTQYLLPIITSTEKPDRRQYLNQSENINHSLKEIAILADVGVQITMYWARHTWGTIARNSKIPISVISEALGHDNEKTTQIYLDSIQTSVVDKANRLVIKGIFK